MRRLLYSLHFRLGVVLLLMLGIIWLSLWIGSHKLTADSSAKDIDDRLSSTALSLTEVTLQLQRNSSTDRQEPASPVDGRPSVQQSSRLLYYEILGAQAELVSRSPGFPTRLDDLSAGFSNRQSAGRSWRIFTLVDRPNGITVRVASTAVARQARTDELNARFSEPLLWGLPFLVALAAIVLWQGLVPLRRIERALARQSPLDLEPIAIDRKRMPTELRRLVDTLDSMTNRIREFVARQRAFAAAAAHELRTPLAACTTQAEIAQRSPHADKRHHALERVRQTIDRMARLVSQLLLLARATHSVAAPEDPPIDLNTAAKTALDSCRPQAEKAKVTLTFDPSARTLEIAGNAELLECMIGNLVANAIDATPAYSDVRLVTAAQGERAVLTIHDQGPGIAAPDSERLFEPFYRKQTSNDDRGRSGLGLSIVKAVVDYHHGLIELTTEAGQGAMVSVHLPVAG